MWCVVRVVWSVFSGGGRSGLVCFGCGLLVFGVGFWGFGFWGLGFGVER